MRLALSCNTWRYQDLWCLPVRKARGIIKWYLHTYCNQTSVTFKSLERRYGKFLSVVALRWAALPVVTHGRKPTVFLSADCSLPEPFTLIRDFTNTVSLSGVLTIFRK